MDTTRNATSNVTSMHTIYALIQTMLYNQLCQSNCEKINIEAKQVFRIRMSTLDHDQRGFVSTSVIAVFKQNPIG